MQPADIIAFRELYNLNRAQFAELMGVSRRAVDYWEDGRTRITEERASKFRELEKTYMGTVGAPPPIVVPAETPKETITPDEIKSIRESRQWTRGQLGNAVGASRSAIDYWERGVYPPSQRFVVSLRKLLKKTPTHEVPAMPAAVVTAEPPVKKLLNAAAEFREWRKQKILNEALDFVKSKTLSPKDTILVFLTLVMDNAPGTTVKDVVEALTEQ